MAQVSYGTITITDTNDIESITMEYAQSTSNSTAPTSGWSENIPTWEEGKYIWQRTRIHKSGTASSADEIGDPVCLTGSTGATGITGRGVSSIVTSYCNYGTGTPAASYSGWSSTVPGYDSSKPNYWVKVVITYTSGSPATDISIYKDNGITDATATAVNANTTAAQAAQDAADALEFAQNTNYAWWSLATAKTVGSNTFAAGSYGTFIRSADFQNNPTNQPNIFVDSNGLHIRKALVDLASFTGTALTFNNPSSGNAQLVIGSSGALQSGDFSITNNTSTFASLGTKIDLTYGEIYTPYFRVSQGSITGGPAAGVYITGNFETTKAKVGGTKQWNIETFTDSQQVKFASMIGPTKSFIQLGASDNWLLDSKKIHTAWYISGNYLSYPQLNDKYYDFGMNLPDSLSDKFLYIRYNSGSNLSTIYSNDSGWTYPFYIDGNGNVHAQNFYAGDTLIGGSDSVAGSLLSYGGTSNRPVYFPSSGDNQGKPVQITVTDNSSATAVTSTDTNLITARTLYYAGYTKNTGTVTSVRVQATSPVQSSTSTAQSATLNTTISLADGYGDTKNPYSSKTKNYVLAAPSGAAGAPSFRLLVASDIPDLSAIYLPLAGGTVTGPVEFGDSVTADDISTGGLVVSGSATFSNNIAANTINGVTVGSTPKFTDTTYTFANGTNGFTVTPSGGSAQTVTVTPSITNNVTGTGTSGSLAKWSGAHTLTDGPAIGSGTTKYLREDGTWQTPSGTYSLTAATYNTLGGVKPAYSSTGAATLTTTAATNTSTPTIAAKTTTSGRYYAVEIDKNGVLFVNVPWTNVNSSYLTTETDPIFGASAAATITSSDITNWNSKTSNTGTVTSVKVQGSNGLTGSGTVTTSGTITISHDDTSSQASSSNSGRTYIQSVTLDDYGHVTGLSTATETVTDTHHTAYLYNGSAATGTNAKSNKSVTSGNVYLNLVENGDIRSSHKLIAAQGLTITSNTSGDITFTSPDAFTGVSFDSDSGKITFTKSGGGVAEITTDNFIITQAAGATGLVDSGGNGLNVGGATTAPVYFSGGIPVAVTSIPYSLISGTPSSLTPTSHTHGNIQNDGTLQTTDVTIGNGDKLVITDYSNSNKIARASLSFGTDTTVFLNSKGEWATPVGTTYTFDGTYNASSNKAATVSTVTNAIGALDGSITGTAGAGKTLTAFNQTDGKVTATFSNISITKSQISDFPTEMTPAAHEHPLSIESDSSSTASSITLAHNTKYKLTAGGKTYLFTTPSDNNTDIKVNVVLGTTTKAYLLGTSATPTSTAAGVTAIADTGVYLDTTAGMLHATTFNGLTLTAATTGFTIAGGTTSKTLTVNNTYTLAAACAKAVDTSISASSTSTNLPTSAAVASFVEGKGYVTSSGVTSITLTQGTGISVSDSGVDITSTGTRTISLATITQSDTTSTASPSHGETVTMVDSITYDTYGRVTGVNTKTVTLPASGNTDAKVTQTAATDNVWRKLLLSYNSGGASTTSITSGTTNGVYYNNNVAINPSTGALRATLFNVADKVILNYNSTLDALVFSFA